MTEQGEREREATKEQQVDKFRVEKLLSTLSSKL
jgi:hypothetical protein